MTSTPGRLAELGDGGLGGTLLQMFPLFTTAASLVPSLDEVMEYQFLVLPTEVSSVSSRGARVCGGPDVSVVNNGGEFGTVAR